MKKTDDQFYIDRIKRGDPSSYSFLVNRYKDMAFTIALKILKNEEDAEDAAQESFVKAYQQIRKFENKSKFSTWLYTIVYRTSISKLQKSKVPVFPIDEDIIENYAFDFSAPQIETILATEQSKYIKNAIAKLPQTESLLITLFYMNENSIKEIGEITGLTESNIKVKLFRARKILEQELHFLL